MTRPAIFHPSARDVIRAFPREVRRSFGKAIWELQQGVKLGMPLSRPIRAVGSGVEELRVKDSAGIYRAFYFTRSARGILVFHAYQKKTQKTPMADRALGKRRLKELLDEEA